MDDHQPEMVVKHSVNHVGEDVKTKVLVLAGGRSAERDVSLSTGAAVSRALNESGAEVFFFDPASSHPPLTWTPERANAIINRLPPDPSIMQMKGLPAGIAMTPNDVSRASFDDVDLVFIALHGGDGENGRLQALLDTCGVAYTGSGMAASSLAMDKHASKRVFVAEGIPTPRWKVIDRGAHPGINLFAAELGMPLIVKPNSQGSTVGLTLVREDTRWNEALEEGFRWDKRLLVEEYIPGREITVAILGDRPLPVVEIIPSHDLYDYECKYTSGGSQYVCPADLTAEQTASVQEIGLKAFHALGCEGYARVDFRMSPSGDFYCLEVNTLPGMTATSLVPKAARAAGIEFPELLQRICELAVQRHTRGD
ncbi:MAG: D-alanine--D-alanine ligase [Candidatus Zixiibacteriota bacterium]